MICLTTIAARFLNWTLHIVTDMQRDCLDLRASAAGSWRTGPAAWGRRHPVLTPCRPARCRRAASSPCPTWHSSWGCWRPRPLTAPPYWAGSRRRRSTCRPWWRPATRKVWWRLRCSRNLVSVRGCIRMRGEERHLVSGLCGLSSPWYMAWAPVQAKRLAIPLALRKTSIWSDCCSWFKRSRWYLSGTKWNWVWP